MGIPFELTMTMAGFYPQGGGELQARIPGGARPCGLQLTERGALRGIRGLSAVANLPLEIGERQRNQALRRLRATLPAVTPELTLAQLPAHTRGTVLLLLGELEFGQACYFALGAPGKRAEKVADEAVQGLTSFLHSDGAVDPWLADQVLLPLAIADPASALRTSEATRHLLTNADVIRLFVPVEIQVDAPLGGPATIHVDPTGSTAKGQRP
jgi:RNA 3'-terminal phosphate cyclase (ATP)